MSEAQSYVSFINTILVGQNRGGAGGQEGGLLYNYCTSNIKRRY